MIRTGYSNLHRSLFNKKIYGSRIDPSSDDSDPSQSEEDQDQDMDSTSVPPPPTTSLDFSKFCTSPPTPMPGDQDFSSPPNRMTFIDQDTFYSSNQNEDNPLPLNVPFPTGNFQAFPPNPPTFNPNNNNQYHEKMEDEEGSSQMIHNPFRPPNMMKKQFNSPQRQISQKNFIRVNSFVTTKDEFVDLESDKSVQNQFSMYRRSSSSNLLLPTIRPGKSKNPQCNTINGKTLGQFFRKKRKHRMILVDCRFPYEYQNGTIKGSVNIYQEHVLRAFFFTKKRSESIIVFYCEYSSKRGPRMYASMRKFDREENLEKYPFLDYPQIYLLEGGYRKFFKRNRQRKYGLCEPDTYCKMDDPKYQKEFQKSWKEMKDSFKAKINVRSNGNCGKRRRRKNRIDMNQYQRHNSFNLRYLHRQ